MAELGVLVLFIVEGIIKFIDLWWFTSNWTDTQTSQTSCERSQTVPDRQNLITLHGNT